MGITFVDTGNIKWENVYTEECRRRLFVICTFTKINMVTILGLIWHGSVGGLGIDMSPTFLGGREGGLKLKVLPPDITF